jgi:tetratricopeptide (TPR) repeat protein
MISTSRQAPWLLLACVLALGLTPRPAHAQDEFDRYLTAAVQLYESLDYEQALEQIQRAKRLARGVKQDVAVALHEGIILADMGKQEQSRTAFRTALLLEPGAKLPITVSPKVSRSFEEVRTSVQKSLARNPRTKPGPPAPAPQEPAPAVTPPAVVQTDRPEQPAAAPKLEVPPPAAPPPYAPTVEARERSRVPVVPVALAGVGVVAAGVGAVFGLQSRSSLEEVESAFAGGSFPTQSEVPAVRARLDDARSQARVANVLFGTAAAAVTGAVVTYLLSGDDTKTELKEAR